MRQSRLFTKTRKEAPADEVAKNATLLIRAGYVHKDMAGVYSFLPLGLRVMEKITGIIREEMNTLGAQELSLAALQEKNIWEKTGRWDDAVVDNWFKTEFKNKTETGLAFTHEEPLTAIVAEYVNSYRDLPFSAYQFQTKFRNEARAKSGIMRGREFLMKDLYSFDVDPLAHGRFYKSASEAYKRVFERVGIGHTVYTTWASGGSFSPFSHEFQAVTDVGEDTIFVHELSKTAINSEVMNDEVIATVGGTYGFTKADLVEKKAIEVGNIFGLGTKFSEPLGLKFKTEDGSEKPVFMGSYGIGVSRLMGAVVEILSDENGIVWPKSISPFSAHLVSLASGRADEGDAVAAAAEELYKNLTDAGVEVLFDDRAGVRAGEKFADSDLIGISTRVIVSAKSLEAGGYEIKDRATGKSSIVSKSDIITALK